MSTGDLKNNLKQLLHELKAAKYGKTLDMEGVKLGSPEAYLPVYHFLFTSYSTKLNKDIVNSNNELYGKSDMRFMEAVYKILRDMFDYKAKITREQFFVPGFAEHKVIMATEIFRVVMKRYSPPKSSSVLHTGLRQAQGQGGMGNLEKVSCEVRAMPDSSSSVSSKQSVPNIAGAIVLPRHSATGPYRKVPKAGVSPGPKHFQEKPTFVAPLPPEKTLKKHLERDIEPVVIRASEASIKENGFPNSNEAKSRLYQEQEVPRQSVAIPDAEEVESVVRRKIADMVSPALVKISERIGMMEISLSDLEEKKKQAMPERPEPTPSAAMVTELTKQMSDIAFKLQTLTSRVTLLENRVTSVEAQLVEEENHRKTLFVSHRFLSANKTVEAAPALEHALIQLAAQPKVANTDVPLSGGSVLPNQGSRSVQPGLRQEMSDVRVGRKAAKPPAAEQVGKQAETEAATKPHSLAFMKTLVSPEDCGSLLTTSEVEAPEEVTIGEMDASDVGNVDEGEQPMPSAAATDGMEQNQHQRKKYQEDSKCTTEYISGKQPPLPREEQSTQRSSKEKTNTGLPFTKSVSPIKPLNPDISEVSFSEMPQDNSSLNFRNAIHGMDSYDADESKTDHRTSTPTRLTQVGLDTSTLDRVSRINQMMAATQQLLQ